MAGHGSRMWWVTKTVRNGKTVLLRVWTNASGGHAFQPPLYIRLQVLTATDCIHEGVLHAATAKCDKQLLLLSFAKSVHAFDP